jgi:hypothetical protein
MAADCARWSCSHSDLPLLSNLDCGCRPCPPSDLFAAIVHIRTCLCCPSRTAAAGRVHHRIYLLLLFTFGPASNVQFGLRLPALSTIGLVFRHTTLAACQRRYMHSGNLESDAFAKCCGHYSPSIPYRKRIEWWNRCIIRRRSTSGHLLTIERKSVSVLPAKFESLDGIPAA